MGGPAQPINVVADAGYSNGQQAEACEAMGIFRQRLLLVAWFRRGDGTLFDRTEFILPTGERHVPMPGRADPRPQTTHAERSYRGLCSTTRSLRSLPSEIAMHRVAATNRYPSPARRGPTAHATTGHAGSDTATTSHRGTSICQFEIPYLRTSRFLLRGLREAANGNQLGRSRLQSETHAEHSRRTQAACSPANHLISLPPLMT